MSTNLEEMPYYQLVNGIMRCRKQVKHRDKAEVSSLTKMQTLLEKEQRRRISSFFR